LRQGPERLSRYWLPRLEASGVGAKILPVVRRVLAWGRSV
jgi:hypothetical protein